MAVPEQCSGLIYVRRRAVSCWMGTKHTLNQRTIPLRRVRTGPADFPIQVTGMTGGRRYVLSLTPCAFRRTVSAVCGVLRTVPLGLAVAMYCQAEAHVGLVRTYTLDC